MNEVYHEYFAEAPPARATVKVELFDPPPPRGDRCRRGVVVARLLPLFVEPRFHSCNRFADGGSLSSLQWLLERLGKAAPPAHTRRACKFVSQNGHSNSLPITPALRDSRPWPKRQSCAEVPPRGQSLQNAGAHHLLNNPIISALASVLKCKLKPTTAADVSAFTSSLSAFTANTVNI
jgi:hypothetical protein